MRELLNLEETRSTPLLRGPYVSLSSSFRQGASVKDLIREGALHEHIANLSPYPHLYGHQESAIRSISARRSTLVSTGTGSGKTECFLYPIISRCLRQRDEGAPSCVTAVIVYPMNALAEDQLGRLRELLIGTGITFGLYVGKTPERTVDTTGVRLPQGASTADYRARVAELRGRGESRAVYPPEERISREEIRQEGGQPRILLTNVNQLELLLTRHRDVEIFDGASLDFLVFDEAHTFSGAQGAETACLIRRLRSFCSKGIAETTCIATSATIADPQRGGAEAGREFAERFFGVPAEEVTLVGEEYEKEVWAQERAATPALAGDPAVHLRNVLEAVAGVEDDEPTAENVRVLRSVFRAMTGQEIDARQWQDSLYGRLSANEVVCQIAEALEKPQPVAELVEDLGERLGREVPEQEVLAWLALGAASRREGRPLLRPVIHGFIRGVGGAVVTFPEEGQGARLWLSREQAAEGGGCALDVTTCTTCGQHYYVHHLADFHLTAAAPGGGEPVGDGVIWRSQDPEHRGNRLVLVDRLVITKDDDDGEGPDRTAPLHLCRYCGTAHASEWSRCSGCGAESEPVHLHAVQQKDDNLGYLTRCLACTAHGRRFFGRYREPARPIRAVTVSDVHMLAQNMIQHAERRRLLVFCDNRQDAAFQAGWMQDHSRRYRMRALIFERIREGSVAIGDLVAHLERLLEADEDLSRSLIPEVWRVAGADAPQEHHEERRLFLRIQVLREVATGMRQRIGLEPWGRMVVDYVGLDADLPFFEKWAEIAGWSKAELRDGVASLLDVARRGRLLLDAHQRIFTCYWADGDRLVQQGYIPSFPGGPQGVKLRRDPSDDKNRVSQWIAEQGVTSPQLMAAHWGVPKQQIEGFLEELWRLLAGELGILVSVTLTGYQGRALPSTGGSHQIDAAKLRLRASEGVYRCGTCRRGHARPTPRMICTAYRCGGALTFEEEDPDNYDLMVLDQQFAMIRPREHSAQVPNNEREKLEREFKGTGESVNTLVCTPTLELGVDIGALDAVLMRNVPPLPAQLLAASGPGWPASPDGGEPDLRSAGEPRPRLLCRSAAHARRRDPAAALQPQQ